MATSTFAMSNVSPVHAYPASGANFPPCGSDTAAEYCIERFAFTPTGGAQREVTPSEIPEANLDSEGKREVNVVAKLSAGYAGLSSTPMQDGVLASLSLNFYDPLSTTLSSSTNTGLRDGLYTVAIRTGDFDPSSMMLIGAYDSYTVVKGADGFFTVTLTARPIPWAAVVNLNGDDSVFQACKASQWTTNCEANMANQRYILATFNMMDTAVMREAARGSWVSTSASTIQVAASTSSLKLKVPAAFTATTVKAVSKPTVTTKKTATAKSFADYAKLTVAKTSTVSLKVSTASKRYCAVVSTKVKGVTTMKLKGLKKGTCKVTVTVTPKKGNAKRETVTLKIT